MNFKENLKNRRLELNLTLDHVAEKLHVSKPTLHRYESGIIDNIPFDKVEKLAEILKVTPSWLMSWDNIKLNEEEKVLLEKYNSLDYMGKHTIDVVLEMELNRYKEDFKDETNKTG
jgi:transcriptional regulator with XRE-family HTH domain